MRSPPPLDPEAERELSHFIDLSALDGGAVAATQHARALRPFLRESLQRGGPGRTTTLIRAEEFCAEILRRPSRSGHVADRWWNALRAFAESMRSIDPQLPVSIDAIEERLVPRDGKRWHMIRRLAGGQRSSRLRPRLVLFSTDLLAVTNHARHDKHGEHALRDWAYVALNCWSSLRTDEVAHLSWEQIQFIERRTDAAFGAYVNVSRPGRSWTLPIHVRASEPLALLFAVQRAADREPAGPVFRSLHPPYARLGYEQEWRILRTSLEAVRLDATRQDLLAAYAYYLKTVHHYTIPDLREVLGYSEVRHARDLLKSHTAWELRQKVLDAELEAQHEPEPGDGD